FNGPGKLMCRSSISHNGNVAHIQRSVLLHFHQNDSIRNEKDVVDYHRKHDDETIRGIRVHKGNQSCHYKTGNTYRLRQTDNLSDGRKSQFIVNTENRQQNRPGWKNYCKQPEVNLNGHDGMPFEFEQQTKMVSQKETRRGQTKIGAPQRNGEDPFS